MSHKAFSIIALVTLVACNRLPTEQGPTPTPLKTANYVAELLWWPDYCDESPDLRYCAGASFRGFVLGKFIPLQADGQSQSCGPHPATFKPDRRLLDLMPDERLQRTQWESYGACTGLSQSDYFEQLATLRKSVHIPRAFVSPDERFSMSTEEVRRQFLDSNRQLQPAALFVFCNSGLLSAVQIRKGVHPAAPTDACDRSFVEVIALMPLAE